MVQLSTALIAALFLSHLNADKKLLQTLSSGLVLELFSCSFIVDVLHSQLMSGSAVWLEKSVKQKPAQMEQELVAVFKTYR